VLCRFSYIAGLDVSAVIVDHGDGDHIGGVARSRLIVADQAAVLHERAGWTTAPIVDLSAGARELAAYPDLVREMRQVDADPRRDVEGFLAALDRDNPPSAYLFR
jgi:glyoxylase-like metal-dependent hydrolase (beta-lactamase superfamily II)